MGNKSSSHLCSGIWILARDGDPEALRRGIERIPPEIKASYLELGDKSGLRTPLAITTLLNHDECVKVLLEAGANPNCVGRDGMGPLHLAVKNNNVTITRLLLEIPQVNCNVVDARGYTPLLVAAEAGHAQVLDALLRCTRVDVFARHGKSGLNTLQIARQACHKANTKDYPKSKECLTLVEKRLLIGSGCLFEYINSQSANKCAWENRYYHVFRTDNPQIIDIAFYLTDSENPSAEMMYHSTWPRENVAQTLFYELEFRFALRAYVTTGGHVKLQDFECAASSADDLAFWVNLPQALQAPDPDLLEQQDDKQRRLELVKQVQEEEQRLNQERLKKTRHQSEETDQETQLSLAELPPPPLLESASVITDDNHERLAPIQTALDNQSTAGSGSTDCLVCFDAVRDSVSVPCGHMAMCMNCAEQVQHTTNKCPVCRTTIQSLIKVFHP